jgi:hypothetical protein
MAAGFGAGAVSLATGGPVLARASGFTQVSLALAQRHYFSGCDYVLDRLDLQTRDGRLASFLGDGKERGGLQQAAAKALRNTVCDDVTDRKRLAALKDRLGRALADCYRARTGRGAGFLIVTLPIEQRRVPVPGGISAPSRPVPSP